MQTGFLHRVDFALGRLVGQRTSTGVMATPAMPVNGDRSDGRSARCLARTIDVAIRRAPKSGRNVSETNRWYLARGWLVGLRLRDERWSRSLDRQHPPIVEQRYDQPLCMPWPSRCPPFRSAG